MPCSFPERVSSMSAFQSALANGDLEAVRRVPKSDLHNHFFLGGNRALVSKWAGKDIAPLDRRLISMSEMHEWVQTRFGALFEGAHGRLKAFEATLVQAKFDGVTRLETGETPWAITLAQRLGVSPHGSAEKRAQPCGARRRMGSPTRSRKRGVG